MLEGFRVGRVVDQTADSQTRLGSLPGQPKRAYREAYAPADAIGSIQYGSLWTKRSQTATRGARIGIAVDPTALTGH